MAKTTKSSSKSSSTSSTSSTSSPSFLTGIFGHIITGSTVSCKATDDTLFCNLTKGFNIMIMIIITMIILYIIISFAYNFMKK
jgi:hypothetical protein